MELQLVLSTVIALIALLTGIGFIINILLSPVRENQSLLKENQDELKQNQNRLRESQNQLRETQVQMEAELKTAVSKIDKIFLLLSHPKPDK